MAADPLLVTLNIKSGLSGAEKSLPLPRAFAQAAYPVSLVKSPIVRAAE
jgi:hypothetical protein